MSAHRTPVRILALIVATAVALCRAEDKPKPPPTTPPTETELRATITKSLGFLAKEGEAWMESKDCNGCHHLPEMLWSHREAKLRGFVVEQAKFDEWLAWADERSKNKGPGLEMLALMKFALPDRPSPELTKIILAEQKPDGSWKPAGQFAGMQKRGEADAQANSARVFLLALAKPETSSDADAALKKAAAFLAKKDAPTAAESLVFRTLYARGDGKPEGVAALRDQILKQQRGDGGWSSIIGENMSDPLATGQVLYALQPDASEPGVAEAIARAQRWLVKTQDADGSWPIDVTHISKVDRSAPEKAKSFKDATMIYTYFGAGWATIGLLQSVPLVDAAGTVR